MPGNSILPSLADVKKVAFLMGNRVLHSVIIIFVIETFAMEQENAVADLKPDPGGW